MWSMVGRPLRDVSMFLCLLSGSIILLDPIGLYRLCCRLVTSVA